MIKTLNNLFKQDREKFVVTKSVQAVIQMKTIWEDGIFLVGKNKYAKIFKFEDINYAVASREDKELLNALDSGATTKLTINNRRLNKADFEQTILISMAEDGLDKYRREYNKMLLDKAIDANSIVQDKYVTVSVLILPPISTILAQSVLRLMQPTSSASSTTSTARARKPPIPLIWYSPCGKVTILRTISVPIPLSLKKIISRWAIGMGV